MVTDCKKTTLGSSCLPLGYSACTEEECRYVRSVGSLASWADDGYVTLSRLGPWRRFASSVVVGLL